MKIIKKGTKFPFDRRVYIMKCRNCGCKFTYTTRDIDVNVIPVITHFIACPQCGYHLAVPSWKRKYRGDD